MEKSIFHAFNMSYRNIEKVAPDLARMGITHVQYPVVQESRVFDDSVYELLSKKIADSEIHNYTHINNMISARRKERLYKDNDFSFIYKQKTSYINQPTHKKITSFMEEKSTLDEIIDTINKNITTTINTEIAAILTIKSSIKTHIINDNPYKREFDERVNHLYDTMKETTKYFKIDHDNGKAIKDLRDVLKRIVLFFRREIIMILRKPNQTLESNIQLQKMMERNFQISRYNYQNLCESIYGKTNEVIKKKVYSKIKASPLLYAIQSYKCETSHSNINILLNDPSISTVVKIISLYCLNKDKYSLFSKIIDIAENIINNNRNITGVGESIVDAKSCINKYKGEMTYKYVKYKFVKTNYTCSIDDNINRWLKLVYIIEFLIYPPWWMTYQPVKFQIGHTHMGTINELRSSINACKGHGLKVIVDVVLNNLAAVAGESVTWAKYLKLKDVVAPNAAAAAAVAAATAAAAAAAAAAAGATTAAMVAAAVVAADEAQMRMSQEDDRDAERGKCGVTDISEKAPRPDNISSPKNYQELLELTKKLKGNRTLNRLPTLEDYENSLDQEDKNKKCIQDVKLLLRNAFGSDSLDMLTPPYGSVEGQEPTVAWMSQALPQVNQDNLIIQTLQNDFLRSLVEIGVDGIRIDAASHISPTHIKRLLDTFNKHYEKESDCSYIEYVGGARFNHDSYRSLNIRLEDFGIGPDLYKNIFVPNGNIDRLKNYGDKKLDREPNLDSVVMIVNHDHIMGSIKSEIMDLIPSRYTYQMSVVYLLQRIYGNVLLMPHDISLPYVRHALKLRKKMFDMKINEEYTETYKDNNDQISFISYKKSDGLDRFMTFFNLTGVEQEMSVQHDSKFYTTYTLGPKSFAWIELLQPSRNIKGANINRVELQKRINNSKIHKTDIQKEANEEHDKLKEYINAILKSPIRVKYKSRTKYQVPKIYATENAINNINTPLNNYFYGENKLPNNISGGKRKTRKQKNQGRRNTRRLKRHHHT